MNVEALLERIGYRHDPVGLEINLTTLRRLQYSFLTQVPFENLDIHLGRENKLDFAHIWHKVVEMRRGGWCYELNELFLQLLTELGFSVRRCAARVILRGEGDPMDHQVSVVELNGRWLVDVGFGQFALGPLAIDNNQLQEIEGSTYLLEPENSSGDEGTFKVSTEIDGQLSDCYVFSAREVARHEFQQRCHWLQTSPDSSFVHKRMCSKHTREGRLTLSGNQLLLNGARVARIPEQEYGDYLSRKFGIVLTGARWITPLKRGK